MTNLERDDPFFLKGFDRITELAAPLCSDPNVNDLYRLAFSQKNLLQEYRDLFLGIQAAYESLGFAAPEMKNYWNVEVQKKLIEFEELGREIK